jgi:hypothetical protein
MNVKGQRLVLGALAAVLLGLGAWAASVRLRPEPRVDQLIVSYLRGSGSRKEVLARETITDQARIEDLLRGIEQPDETDVGGSPRCPFDIQMEFLKGDRCVFAARLTADGCGLVWVCRGKVPAAGKSGLVAPPHFCLKDYVARQRELTQKARLADATR